MLVDALNKFFAVMLPAFLQHQHTGIAFHYQHLQLDPFLGRERSRIQGNYQKFLCVFGGYFPLLHRETILVENSSSDSQSAVFVFFPVVTPFSRAFSPGCAVF
jgi:hypothetical protein